MGTIPPFKECTQCHKPFPTTSEYYGKHKMGKYGLRAACKKCTNTSNKLYKYTEAGKEANERYVNGQAGKATREKTLARYSEKNPEKRHAKREVLNAVRRGDLPPIASQQCRDCGKQAQHYHHWSYLREHWLDVIPLCIKCHKAVHTIIIGKAA